MKKKIIIGVLVAVIAAVALAHFYFSDRGRWTTEAEFTGLARTLAKNDLVSRNDPRVIIRFDPSFKHQGGQKFILYGVADTEQHFFVERGENGKLKSLYWIQFEGYLPDNSYSYDYDNSPGRLQLGDFDFYVDTEVVASDPNRKRRRGTDGAMARQLLQSKGYTLPLNFLYARLVHLTDETKRKELMVIYIEDLDPYGMSPADLQEGGDNAEHWPQLEKDMLDRIEGTMALISY